MALQDTIHVQVLVNSVKLRFLRSVRRSTDSGRQSYDILVEGLGGFSEGSGRTRIDFEYFIPISGPEIDWQGLCVDGSYVTVQLIQGPNVFVGQGKFLTEDFGQSAGDASSGSAAWEGEFKKLQ